MGLDAQRARVQAHVAATGVPVIAEYTEIESGRKIHRLELDKALARCAETGASLVIAKLDRLARDVQFLATLMNGKVEFTALDLPGASRFHLHIMAAVAELEARTIAERTRAGLAVLKARGRPLGFHAHKDPERTRQSLRTVVTQAAAAARSIGATARHQKVAKLATSLRKDGWPLAKIATVLTENDAPAPRGGAWCAKQVQRLLAKARR